MFNSVFDEIGASKSDFYPENLWGEIDTLSKLIYKTVNKVFIKLGLLQHKKPFMKP